MQDINISTIIGSTVPVEEQLKLIKMQDLTVFS